MPTIKVRVDGKIAENLTPEVELVCGNEDYEVEFEFDESWAGANFKTGLFIRNGELIAKPFDGNVCPVPRIDNVTLLAVGVKSSDGRLFTTTPAYVNCLKSASDLATNKIPAPTQDVYDEIIALINKYIGQGGSSGIDEEAVKKLIAEETADLVAKSDRDEFVKGGLTESTETWTDEEKASACETIGAVEAIKESEINGTWYVYGTGSNGERKLYQILDGVGAHFIPIRDAYGSLRVPEPKFDNQSTPKSYVDDKTDALSQDISVINIALEQSGLLKKYKQPIEQEYTERVTADGANVLDGSKAVLKKVVGDTVACKNLFNFDEIANNKIAGDLPNLVDYDKKSIHFPPAKNLYALAEYGSKFDILNAVLNITEAGVYSLRVKVTDINGNALQNAQMRSCWAIATVEGTKMSDNSAIDGLYYFTYWTFTAEDIANFKNTANFRLYMYTASDKTTMENIDCYVSEFTFCKGDYTLATMPQYTPIFTGLKSASFGGIESTNADGTETAMLAFPKTETPLGVTIDFETKKITDYGVDLVLTGTESWYYYDYGKYQSVIGYDWGIPIGNKAVADYVSTDSEKTGDGYGSGNMWCGYNGTTGFFWLGILAKLGYLEKGTTPTIEEKNEAMTKFKSWLAERYASGNPVTVRYLARDLQSETDFTADNEYTAYKGGTEKVLENDGNQYGADNTLTQDYILVTEVK